MRWGVSSDGSHYEKRGNGEAVCIDDEIPFDIPDAWEWARVSSVFNLVRGSGIKRTEVTASGEPCVRYGELYTTYRSEIKEAASHTASDVFDRAQKLLDGEIVATLTGENDIDIGRAVVNMTGETLAFGGDLLALKGGYIDGMFAMLCFNSPYMGLQRTAAASGNIIVHLSADKIGNFLMAIPPLDEQKRITHRASALIPLVDDYGTLESVRERLDAELPDRLRKSILQLAVQGKLVEQDPADEPASVLLERIRAERATLVKAKKLRALKGGEPIIYRSSDGGYYEKRGKGDPVCIDDEIPFEIPDSWAWVRLESVTTYIQRGKSPKYSPVKKYPVVAQKCNQWSGFSLELAKFIDPATVSSYAEERILQDGDLLWNSTGLGTLGRMAIYDSSVNEYGWAVADSHVTVIRTLPSWLDYRYAFAYFAGPSVQSVIEDQASGSTKQKELAQDTVRSYLIPIPPHREQTRIAEELGRVLSQLTNR